MKYSVQMHGYKYAISGYLGTSTEGLNLASQPAQAVKSELRMWRTVL